MGGGTDWGKTAGKVTCGERWMAVVKTDGTLWTWGRGNDGVLAQNSQVKYSSPVQVPGTSWSAVTMVGSYNIRALKTDGTMWTWGANQQGRLGHNNTVKYSSPVQVPGTDWTVGATGQFVRKDA